MRGVPGVATKPCGAVRPGEACRSRRDRPGAAAGIRGAPHRPNGASTAYTKRVEVSARLGCRASGPVAQASGCETSPPSGQATPGQGPDPSVFVASRTGARLLIGSSLLCQAHRQ